MVGEDPSLTGFRLCVPRSHVLEAVPSPIASLFSSRRLVPHAPIESAREPLRFHSVGTDREQERRLLRVRTTVQKSHVPMSNPDENCLLTRSHFCSADKLQGTMLMASGYWPAAAVVIRRVLFEGTLACLEV